MEEKDTSFRPGPESQPHPGGEKIVPFPKPPEEKLKNTTDLPAKVAEEYIKKHGPAPRTRFEDPLWRRLTRSLRGFLGQK